MSDWTQHAQRELEREGYRLSGPRSAVVETLDDLGCSVTAKEIADRLHNRGQDIGLASVYRTLELLERLKLVQRVDVGEGLEDAIHRLSRRVEYSIDAHDVTLRGKCPACRQKA